ncbi:hypothetical protein JSE7799_03660 [Jannaschia seosinensis]|uniref:Uncharacterized protein n=1 Tax=Jannaschia seosinensis TaxID=313367 RepID=A0A0M7BDX1_9RHOB|nr:hypothetical protein JSE7799_03660 [Jannaschia seosinensis]
MAVTSGSPARAPKLDAARRMRQVPCASRSATSSAEGPHREACSRSAPRQRRPLEMRLPRRCLKNRPCVARQLSRPLRKQSPFAVGLPPPHEACDASSCKLPQLAAWRLHDPWKRRPTQAPVATAQGGDSLTKLKHLRPPQPFSLNRLHARHRRQALRSQPLPKRARTPAVEIPARWGRALPNSRSEDDSSRHPLETCAAAEASSAHNTEWWKKREQKAQTAWHGRAPLRRK